MLSHKSDLHVFEDGIKVKKNSDINESTFLLEVNKNVSEKKISCKAPQVHLKYDIFFFVVACMLYVA